MRYWIGTSGYNYPEWRGSFYPEKLAAKAMLAYYAERFNTVDEVTWKKAIGGQPHRTRTRGNVLFHDGSVYMVKVYTTKSVPRVLSAKPWTTLQQQKQYTDLEDWMICHPGHAIAGSVNSKKIEDTWQKGRPLPSF